MKYPEIDHKTKTKEERPALIREFMFMRKFFTDSIVAALRNEALEIKEIFKRCTN